MKRAIDMHITQYQRQQGVALVISMILLTVITLLSLTAMRSANLDTRIAVNHQHKQFAFQAAESALTRLIAMPPSETEDLRPATIASDPVVSTDWYQKSDADAGTPVLAADLVIDMTGEGSCRISGYGLGSITCLYYQVDATGKFADTNATAHNRMEIALPKPSGN